MVERNVLGSNLLRFLAATTGNIPESELPGTNCDSITLQLKKEPGRHFSDTETGRWYYYAVTTVIGRVENPRSIVASSSPNSLLNATPVLIKDLGTVPFGYRSAIPAHPGLFQMTHGLKFTGCSCAASNASSY